MALGDAGIVEHAGQPVEQRLPAAERSRARRLGFGLVDTCGGTAVASDRSCSLAACLYPKVPDSEMKETSDDLTA